MNTHASFPYRLAWTAQEIADAVPLRLFELFAFDLGTDSHGSQGSADQLPAPRRLRGGYRPQVDLPARLLVR